MIEALLIPAECAELTAVLRLPEVDTDPSPPYASAAHKVCQGCPSHCCKSRFGWDRVSLYPWDMANEKLVAAMKAKGVLDDEDPLHPSMRFEEEGCSFLRKDGGCGVYDFRPVSCRNVLCFDEPDAFRNPQGPVNNMWPEWYARLEEHDLHPDKETGTPHWRAAAEKIAAVEAFYSLTVECVDRGDDPSLCRVSYTLAGNRESSLFDWNVRQVENGVPREIRHFIVVRVRQLMEGLTQNELQGRRAMDATVGNMMVMPGEEDMKTQDKETCE